jgi:predicted PurR-regulated permease PerM
VSEDPVTAQRLRQGLPVFVALASILLVVATMAALYLGREILVPVTLAILLSFVLVPAVRMLRRLRVPRVPAVILVVVIVFGALFGIGSLIASEASQLASDLPRYTQVMRTKIKDLRGATAGAGTLSRIVDMVQDLSATLQPPPAAELRGEPGSRTHPLTVEISPARASVVDTLQTFAGPILHPLATTGLILIFTIFILLQREDLRNRAIKLAGGSGDLRRTTAAIDDATSRLSRFFLAQLALNSAFGVVIGLGLWIIGVPSPTLFGVLAAILRFVPYIGAAISALLPLILAAAVDPGWGMVIATAALFLVVEPICGHVIEPLLYGHSTGLSPIAVILAATIWTFLWGPIGLVLATPLTVCLVVLGRHVDSLEFLDILLGDRPPLTPVENFYQRMLAGDPDEARDLGEAMLKDRSLSSYYDEVALKGLQLAANDFARGVVTPAQLENIRNSAQALVEDFEDHPDAEPARDPKAVNPNEIPTLAERTHTRTEAVPGQAPPRDNLPESWRGEAPVLCVAGRGPLDEASSAMLAQLLRKHGLGARVIGHQAVSRDRIRDLDLTGVAMICISYLDISGSPAHLRYLLERLKRRAPHLPVLVGLWPVGEKVLTDATLGRQVGADVYVSSLRQAVEACLTAASKASGEVGRAA